VAPTAVESTTVDIPPIHARKVAGAIVFEPHASANGAMFNIHPS